jgi:hypothetical protein
LLLTQKKVLIIAYLVKEQTMSALLNLSKKKVVNEIRSSEPKDPNSSDTAWNRFLQENKENEKTKEYGPRDSKTSNYK